MFKRLRMFGMCVCILLCAAVLPVGAAPLENNVLIPEKTALLDGDGTVTYSEQGALVLTSSTESGAAAAVTLDQFINIRTVRYMQLCVTATAPFNVAVKVIGEQSDLYPQLVGPAWYEAFGLSSPPKDGYIPAGSYILSLDIVNYLEYNGMAINEDGYVTMESVFVMVNGVGTVTLDRLIFGNESAFTMADGQSGTGAPTMQTRRDPNEADVTSVSQAIDDSVDGVFESEDLVLILVLVLLATGVIVLAMVTIAVSKKKNRENEEESEEIYGDLQTKLGRRGGVPSTPVLLETDEPIEEPPAVEAEAEPEEAAPLATEESAEEAVDAPEEAATTPPAEPTPDEPAPAAAKPAPQPRNQPHPSVKQKQYPSSKNGGKKKSGKKKSGKKKK